jgi:hypothetical protein
LLVVAAVVVAAAAVQVALFKQRFQFQDQLRSRLEPVVPKVQRSPAYKMVATVEIQFSEVMLATGAVVAVASTLKQDVPVAPVVEQLKIQRMPLVRHRKVMQVQLVTQLLAVHQQVEAVAQGQ